MRQLWAWLAVLVMLWGIYPSASAAEWGQAPEAVVLEASLPPVSPGQLLVPGIYVEVVGDEADARVLRRMARHGNTSVRELSQELGLPVGGTIRVTVAPSQQAFLDLQPGSPPTWADATAYPDRGMIFLRSPAARPGTAQDLGVVLDHELTHILLGRAFAPNTPPRWLQEGVARVMAGEHTPETTRELARGFLTGNIRSLANLDEGFYSHHGHASLAYAQAADFIQWLRSSYGDDDFRMLLKEMAGGRDLRGALYVSTGDFLEDVEREWRDRLTRDGGVRWYALFSQDLAWLVAALLGVLAIVVQRRRFHRRLGEMAQEEAAHEAMLEAIRRSWRTG